MEKQEEIFEEAPATLVLPSVEIRSPIPQIQEGALPMSEAASAVVVATEADLTGINLQVEPNFESYNGNATKYEVKAEEACIANAKDFSEKKTLASAASNRQSAAYRVFVMNLATAKAIKVGKGGQNGEWGDFLDKLNKMSGLSLKRRTVDRWIVKAVFSEKGVGVPLWVVKQLDSLRRAVQADAKPQPVRPIELTPLSLDDRYDFVLARDRILKRSNVETFWQIVFDAVVNHEFAQEQVRDASRVVSFIEEPESLLEKMESAQ